MARPPLRERRRHAVGDATSDKQLALELSVGEKRFEQILSARDRPRVGWYGLTNVEHRRFVYVYGGLSRPIWVPEQTDCYPMRGSERCLWSTTPAHASTLPIEGTSIEVAVEDTGDDGYMLFYVSESRFGLGKSPLGERVPCELSGSGAHELAAGAPATPR